MVNEKKTGLLFFVFLLIVALFLAYAFWNQEEGASSANELNNESAGPTNANSRPKNANQGQEAGNSNTNSIVGSQLASSEYGFSFVLREGDLVTETEAEDIHTFQLNNDDKIVILSAELLDFVKSENGAISEEAVMVDGASGQRVNGVDARDGAKFEFIVVVYNNRLYDFQGSAEFLDRVIQSFKFEN